MHGSAPGPVIAIVAVQLCMMRSGPALAMQGAAEPSTVCWRRCCCWHATAVSAAAIGRASGVQVRCVGVGLVLRAGRMRAARWPACRMQQLA